MIHTFMLAILFLFSEAAASQFSSYDASASVLASPPLNAGLKYEIDKFHELIAWDRYNASAHEILGMLYQVAGDAPNTVKYLQMAHSLNPAKTTSQLLFHLANNLKAIGENHKAVEAYGMALQRDPTNIVYLMLLATTLEFVGNVEMALQAFRTVGRMRPPERVATWLMIYEASALARSRSRGKQAVYQYRQMLGIEKDKHASWLTSGVLFSSRNMEFIHIHRAGVERFSRVNQVKSAVCREDVIGKSGGDLAQVYLQKGQWECDCKRDRILLLELGRQDGRTGKIGSEISGFGFGAMMHVLTVAMSYCVKNDRILVLRSWDNWWYTDGPDCPSRSFHCYFKPIGKCTEEMIDEREVVRLSIHTERERVVLSDCRLDNFLNSEVNRRYVPPRFMDQGLLWWRSQLAEYLLQPNAAVLGHVNSVKRSIGWSGGFKLGIHIRHGDKKTESAIIPVSNYVEGALAMNAALNPGMEMVVFVASDDGGAIPEAARLLRGKAKMLTVEQDMRDISTATDNLTKYHSLNITQYALEAITNMLLLAECNHFVGTLSSNFGRLAYELQRSRHKEECPIALTMDVFWHAFP